VFFYEGCRLLWKLFRSVPSFFSDIFGKSPILGVFMVLGLVLGGAYGIHVTGRGWEEGFALRFLIFAVGAIAAGGCFLGMVLGIMVETIVMKIRGEDKKKKQRARKRVRAK
jgi:hypothetical protein